MSGASAVSDNPDSTVIQTDLLIVGTGPAGGASASFLGYYGLKGIVIGQTSSAATTPRAHITNMAALECFRDIGLEAECLEAATTGDCMQHTRWCHSMAGEEFGRIYSWGNDPKRKGDYDAASPCNHVDLPQTLLEPILIRRAIQSGFDVRFNTTFISFSKLPSGVIRSEIKDNLTSQTYFIDSHYLFGCDGARSQILQQLNIPLLKKPGQGLAINILAKCDLSHLIESRTGNLHWVMQPGEEYPEWGWTCIARMVKPWHEWMFILFPFPGTGVKFSATPEEYLKRVKELIGDDSIPVEILDVSKWYINEVVAEYYSDGNVFLLGDAVHRHPPLNGLGSNTCVQDAYNLAWKIAHVMKGAASPKLLESYTLERQPVGHTVVTRANQGLRDHFPVWQALGLMEKDNASVKRAFSELSEATPAGKARRKALQDGIGGSAHEFHGVGVEMNQRYESPAIYLADETTKATLPEDPVLEHRISTYPGARLPHAWLNTRVPGKQISTQDLAGHGNFVLFTGIGGDKWRGAAVKVNEVLGIEVKVFSIGWLQDYEDVYSDWAKRREIEEEGCVLVRPDRFVAWRSMGMIDDCEEKLLHVVKSILSR